MRQTPNTSTSALVAVVNIGGTPDFSLDMHRDACTVVEAFELNSPMFSLLLSPFAWAARGRDIWFEEGQQTELRRFGAKMQGYFSHDLGCFERGVQVNV